MKIPGLKAWFDARSDAYFTFSTGAQISAWVSRAGSLGTIPWTQATSGNQPLRNLATSTFNNKNTVLFDGVDDQLVTSNANAWKFLHDGTGCSIFSVRRIDSTLAANMNYIDNDHFSTSEIGIVIGYNTTPVVNIRVFNGGGTGTTNNMSPAGSGVRDSSAWDMYGHITGTATYARSGSTLTNADAQAPSSANPTRALVISGAVTNATVAAFKGHLACLQFYDHVLSASERATLSAWAASEYGVAA